MLPMTHDEIEAMKARQVLSSDDRDALEGLLAGSDGGRFVASYPPDALMCRLGGAHAVVFLRVLPGEGDAPGNQAEWQITDSGLLALDSIHR